jgi:hypothetical protein
MKSRYLSVTLVIATVAVFSSFSDARAEGKFNLAKGARGEVCLTCHETFKKKLEKRFVHTPLKQGNCTGCLPDLSYGSCP